MSLYIKVTSQPTKTPLTIHFYGHTSFIHFIQYRKIPACQQLKNREPKRPQMTFHSHQKKITNIQNFLKE